MVHLTAALRANHLVRSASPSLSSCLPVQRNVVSAISQGFRDPDKFVQEFVGSSDERLVEELSRFIEHFAYGTEVDVPENVDQTEFAHDRQ